MATSQTTAAGKYIDELVARFPDAPSLTLAKKAYKAHPELWSSLEACRSMVRKRFGINGKRAAQKTRDKSLFRKPRRAGNPWKNVIPPPLTHFDNWGAVCFKGPMRALVLSDLHIPYHDATAVELALEFGRKRKADFILLNGDVLDCYSVSHWLRDPRMRNFAGELADLKQFLRGLRKAFGKQTKLVYKLGNHEDRFEIYLKVKAPELLDVPEFEWEHLAGLSENGIQLVKDRRPVRLGELNVIHGHEYRFQVSNPVNPARGMFLRAKTHCLGGHFHQSSSHSEKNLEQKTVSTWSTGCLCNMFPSYAPLNSWNLGFAWVEIDKSGGFHVENMRVVDNRVW